MHKASNIIDGKASAQCVRGIAVKLPMLAHINEKHVLSLIRLKKDVDSFSPLNLG